MGILDQVTEMKNRGMPDQNIISNLQSQGFSPADIKDAMGRAQIKSAVSDSGEAGRSLTAGMQHSILSAEGEPDALPTEGNISDEDLTPPVPSQNQQQTPMYMTKEISQGGQPQGSGMYTPNPNAQQDYYQQQQYQYPDYSQDQQQGYEGGYDQSAGYDYGYPQAGVSDTDTMIEVAEQVFSEKTKALQKKIDDLVEFKTMAQSKLDDLSDRMKKIESIIDKIQSSILEKIGGYGYGLESIRKEMGMMQDSFGKMVNKLADRAEQRHVSSSSRAGSVTVHRSKRTTRKSSR